MESQGNIYINPSYERFVSRFTNRIDETLYINYYIYRYNDILPYITSPEITLPTFTEQELLIPDDAVCGITFEKPNCITSCSHYYCRAAITTWLEQQKNECKKMTCPTCRTEITQVFVAKNR